MGDDKNDAARLAEKLTGEPAREGAGDPGDRGKTGTKRPFDHGRFDIRIGYDGRWHYQGSPIDRKPLVKLFSSVLKRDGEGRYWLETPVEKGLIEVEDAPFLIVTADWAGEGQQQIITLTTNLDEKVTVSAAHPLRVATHPETGEPRPYVMVRDGLEARLTRPVFYELVERAVAAPDRAAGWVGVWSGGTFHEIGEAGG